MEFLLQRRAGAALDSPANQCSHPLLVHLIGACDIPNQDAACRRAYGRACQPRAFDELPDMRRRTHVLMQRSGLAVPPSWPLAVERLGSHCRVRSLSPLSILRIIRISVPPSCTCPFPKDRVTGRSHCTKQVSPCFRKASEQVSFLYATPLCSPSTFSSVCCVQRSWCADCEYSQCEPTAAHSTPPMPPSPIQFGPSSFPPCVFRLLTDNPGVYPIGRSHSLEDRHAATSMPPTRTTVSLRCQFRSAARRCESCRPAQHQLIGEPSGLLVRHGRPSSAPGVASRRQTELGVVMDINQHQHPSLQYPMPTAYRPPCPTAPTSTSPSPPTLSPPARGPRHVHRPRARRDIIPLGAASPSFRHHHPRPAPLVHLLSLSFAALASSPPSQHPTSRPRRSAPPSMPVPSPSPSEPTTTTRRPLHAHPSSRRHRRACSSPSSVDAPALRRVPRRQRGREFVAAIGARSSAISCTGARWVRTP